MTEREPLCALAMRLAIASPRPVPSFLYVVNGWKMCSRCSAGMPHPLSEIFTQTAECCLLSFADSYISRWIFRSAFSVESTASRALCRRFKSVCLSFIVSQLISGSSSGIRDVNSISVSAMEAAKESEAVRKKAAASVGERCNRSLLL